MFAFLWGFGLKKQLKQEQQAFIDAMERIEQAVDEGESKDRLLDLIYELRAAHELANR